MYCSHSILLYAPTGVVTPMISANKPYYHNIYKAFDRVWHEGL